MGYFVYVETGLKPLQGFLQSASDEDWIGLGILNVGGGTLSILTRSKEDFLF